MEKVYDNSGVKTRYLTEKLDWYLEEHNWSERNFLFKKNALKLLKESIKETIEKTNTRTCKISFRKDSIVRTRVSYNINISGS